MVEDPVLAGRTALVLRDPARAGATVAALAARGARAVVCRLIDFELPEHTAALDAGLRRLLAGRFDWLVLTSANTVRALSLRAAALGLVLQVPAATRIAVVGEATARAAASLGAPIDFMPGTDHSARGMLAEWQELNAPPTGARPTTAFMPQADIASNTLREGFAARGWEAEITVAYRTVPAPADPARALEPVTGQEGCALPAGARLLTRAQLPAAMPGVHAVFFSSPSTVDGFLALVPEPAAGLDLVAIGESTAARLRDHGLEPRATATFPTPQGLVGAWEQAAGAGAHPPS